MTTRRQVLAAAIAAPIAVIPMTANAAPSFICAPTAPSADWIAHLTRLEDAAERATSYHDGVFSPAFEAWKTVSRDAMKELERQIDAIPHYETQALVDIAHGGKRTLSTAYQSDVLIAERFNRHPNLAGEDPSLVRCCAELHPQALARSRRADELRRDFVPPKIDQAIWSENKRLEEESGAAFRAVIEFEPRSINDLVAKVTFLKEQDLEIDHDEMLADLARVFGRVAQ